MTDSSSASPVVTNTALSTDFNMANAAESSSTAAWCRWPPLRGVPPFSSSSSVSIRLSCSRSRIRFSSVFSGGVRRATGAAAGAEENGNAIGCIGPEAETEGTVVEEAAADDVDGIGCCCMASDTGLVSEIRTRRQVAGNCYVCRKFSGLELSLTCDALRGASAAELNPANRS